MSETAAPDIDALIALAGRLADASRPVVLRHYRPGIGFEDKADASPVTAADREAEAAMRAIVAAEHPDHGIVGEELEAVAPDAEYVWVFDPIDGTRSFISGIPLFGTLIALCRHGKPILGVIDQPVLDERWVGAAGRPTTLNGAPVRGRPCPDLAAATVCATTPDMFHAPPDDAFYRLADAVKLVRFGTECYAYGLLASGWVDLVAEANMKVVDYISLVPVVEGAGGVISDWQGRPLDLGCGATRVLAAGDATAHARALALLGGA
jgi:inositol-phosphate phosphatase/L-galactose 1-phosphate phosphatase/histidinol-phosphatase